MTTKAQTIREGEVSVPLLLAARPRPTGIFCANDLLAYGVIRGLLNQEIAIPQEMAVVGYDDIELASLGIIPLTTIRQPKYELGLSAAQLLLDEVQQPEVHQHRQIVYQPELVVRASSWSK